MQQKKFMHAHITSGNIFLDENGDIRIGDVPFEKLFAHGGIKYDAESMVCICVCVNMCVFLCVRVCVCACVWMY